MGQIQIVRGFEGVSRPAVYRLRAKLPSPLGCLQKPGDGCRHIGGGGNVQVFMLAVLPAQSAKFPVLENNTALDLGEYRPLQNSV